MDAASSSWVLPFSATPLVVGAATSAGVVVIAGGCHMQNQVCNFRHGLSFLVSTSKRVAPITTNVGSIPEHIIIIFMKRSGTEKPKTIEIVVRRGFSGTSSLASAEFS
jgi:hypothetical protein